MNNARDQIDFSIVHGEKERPVLTVYSLSTCAFCRKAMKYLESNGYGYRYCQLDELEFDLKRAVKKELKERFGDLPVFPVLTIDDSQALSGFVEQKWAELLGI